MRKTAVITGASRGFGQELAIQIARQMPQIDRFVLVARSLEKLHETASLLPEGKVECHSIDLSTDEGLAEYAALLTEEDDILFLANNAGCGYLGNVAEDDLSHHLHTVDLNVRALTGVAAITVRHMPCGAHMLNVGSIAGFCPNPRMTVYSSTKSYVYAFSRGLGFELKRKGVSVTVVCPCPMDTNFLDSGNIRGKSKTFQTLPYCDPKKEAEKAVRAAIRGKAVYTPLAFYKLYHFLSKIVPTGIMMHMAKT